MKCPECGGQMVLIDRFQGIYLCDICWYEIDLDGADLDNNSNNDLNNN